MKNMARNSLSKSTAAIFVILSIFSIAEVAFAKSTRKFLDSSNPLAKAIILVSQIDGVGVMGNGVLVGDGGCYAMTNFHVAFGKSKDDKTGAITLVDKIEVGHLVQLDAAFDSRRGKFTKSVKAKVVEFGNYEQDTRRGKTQDYAVLKLNECLGPGYGISRFETDADKRIPSGKISSVALAQLDGKFGIVIEESCPAFEELQGKPVAQAPLTGMLVTNYFFEEGTSGSMVLATDESGNSRLVGLNQGGDFTSDGKEVSVAVHARSFNKVLASVLGEGPFTSSSATR
ncbi:MAG: hypothetical protein KIS83_13660 [Rubrivivax sp.]|nr:hypothetical protein [Rubrivivax sp.]